MPGNDGIVPERGISGVILRKRVKYIRNVGA